MVSFDFVDILKFVDVAKNLNLWISRTRMQAKPKVIEMEADRQSIANQVALSIHFLKEIPSFEVQNGISHLLD
jgi:hypothetical protein